MDPSFRELLEETLTGLKYGIAAIHAVEDGFTSTRQAHSTVLKSLEDSRDNIEKILKEGLPDGP